MLSKRMIDYYKDVVIRTSELSYSKKLKVGAIIVKDGSIISHSWNGTPPGSDNSCEDKIYVSEFENVYPEIRHFDEERNYHYYYKTVPEVSHAEESAILKIATSTQSSVGAQLFCTLSCCQSCAKLILKSKISEFYFINDYKSLDGIKFLEKYGVKVIKI